MLALALFLLTGCAEFAVLRSGDKDLLIEVNQAILWPASPGTTQVVYTIAVPRDYEGRQQVVEKQFSHKPSVVFDVNGITYARFTVFQFDRPTVIWARYLVKISRCDLTVLSWTMKNPPPLTPVEHDLYLKKENFIDTGDPQLEAEAARLAGKDLLGTLESIYRFVIDRLRYERDKTGVNQRGALNAYEKGEGNCQSYSDLFVTLCRINRIPARVVTGLVRGGEDEGHAWVEAYVDSLGWVPFDPTYGDSDKDTTTTFGTMGNYYIYVSNVRNNETLNGHFIDSYSWRGDRPEVNLMLSVRAR